MSPHPLTSSWQRTRALLAAAENRLDDDSGLAAFREYLSHNELGLAFDELVAAAETASADARTWGHLHAAAQEMNLYVEDSPHARTAERCRRRVEAAD